MIIHESSSDSDIDDASLALMVKKTTKMLKKHNKSGIKFDGKKKFFTSSKRKPISKIDCYNCGELGHLAHQCPKPPNENTRTRTMTRKMNLVMKKMKRRRTNHTRRRMVRRKNTTKKGREAKLTL
jgi:hypothetical protein